MFVVLRELEVPVHLAGVGVEGQQGIAVEVISGASFTAIRGRRIHRGPENLIRGGVIGSSVPSRSAAHFPRVAFPRVMAGFARTGHGVEAPFAFAGGCVVGVDEAAHAVLPAGYSNYNQILHRQWRDSEAVPGA